MGCFGKGDSLVFCPPLSASFDNYELHFEVIL
jgi:hypothetical protein